MYDAEEHFSCSNIDDAASITFQEMLQNQPARSPDVVLFRLDEADEYCRVCLKTGTIPIFSHKDLSYDLNYFTGIDVSATDSFPQLLCSLCRNFLDSAIAFRDKAQKTDHILKEKAEREERQDTQSTCDSANDVFILTENIEESSDADYSESSVYLEYAETVNDSDVEGSQVSNLNDGNLEDTLSIPDSGLGNEELQSLVAGLNKNGKFPRCEICNITFRTTEQVEEHSLTHKNIVICDVCENIVHVNAYEIHIKIHKEHFKLKRQKLGKLYEKVKCNICYAHFTKAYMKTHMAKHDSENPTRNVKCTICNKILHKQAYLSSHMQRVHFKSPQDQEVTEKVKCPICLRMVNRTTYKAHAASHNNRKVFVCDECGKELASKSSLATHVLIHRDEYLYKCDFCPYRGKHPGLLKVHVRTHTKDYPYKCDTCNASFTTKSNLTAHQKTHSDSVRCICPTCGKCFASESTLRQHKISVHDGIKAFKCDICAKCYGKKDVLVAHKKRVHNVYSANKQHAAYTLADKQGTTDC